MAGFKFQLKPVIEGFFFASSACSSSSSSSHPPPPFYFLLFYFSLFVFTVSLNAFTVVQCTGDGIEWLSNVLFGRDFCPSVCLSILWGRNEYLD
jgi:quinol-cytochrome oxidoreductase complex cytochrome b subunit